MTITCFPAVRKSSHPANTAIYCRVSTILAVQGNSFQNQINYLSKYVKRTYTFSLISTYADRKSGANVDGRPEFQRLLHDCEIGKINQVVTRTVSRFGRNTIDTLQVIRRLKQLGIDVWFVDENLHTLDSNSELVLTILAAFAQEESRNRCANIKWGHKRRFEANTSKIYTWPCYGYKRDDCGELVIYEQEAFVVNLIYYWYLEGYSLTSIIYELKKRKINSPRGCDTWGKKTIDMLLSNQKYIGISVCGKTVGYEFPNKRRIANKGQEPMYYRYNNNERIITDEQFEAVQTEKARRSNVTVTDGIPVRSRTRYKTTKNSTQKISTGKQDYDTI